MKKKVRQASKAIIFYINVETKQKRGFSSQKAANEFIDSVDKPNLWDCVLDKDYYNREIKNFEESKKIGEIHIRALELINLNNHIKVIAKVLGVSDSEFRKILKALELNQFIIKGERNHIDSYSYDNYEITKKGDDYLNRMFLKGACVI